MQCTAYLSLYLALFVLFSHSAERRLHGHRGAGGGLWHDTTREEHETGQGPTPRRNQRLSTHENTSSTHTRNRAAPKGFGSATGVGGAGHKRGQGTYTRGNSTGARAHPHLHIIATWTLHGPFSLALLGSQSRNTRTHQTEPVSFRTEREVWAFKHRRRGTVILAAGAWSRTPLSILLRFFSCSGARR